MALANPSAKFDRLPALALRNRPYERRTICVIPASMGGGDHRAVVMTKCGGGHHTHFTRQKVVDAVARGEMQWCDRHHNTAMFTVQAAGTWQKSQSGAVATMQLVVGARGRYVPFAHRESEMVL
jgi:hypothetical protein